jgi:hypothetical protein
VGVDIAIAIDIRDFEWARDPRVPMERFNDLWRQRGRRAQI